MLSLCCNMQGWTYGERWLIVEAEERGGDGDAAEELDEERAEEWQDVLHPYAVPQPRAPRYDCPARPTPWVRSVRFPRN